MTSEWLLQDKNGFTCRIIHGDSREILKNLQCRTDLLMMSPPYADARKGLYESVSPDYYSQWFSSFHSVFWQILKPRGSLIINIKDKIIEGIKHRYVWQTILNLNQLGWNSIDDFLWHKKTSMPGYWPTRLRDAWEYVFHLSKTKNPYFDQESVKVPVSQATLLKVANIHKDKNPINISATGSGFGRDITAWKDKTHVAPTNVLHISTETHNRKHPAVYPVSLPLFFIKLLSKPQGLVLDPFAGSGTTGVAAIRAGRHCVLIDNKYEYCLVAKERLEKECGMIFDRKNKENLFERPIAQSSLSPLH